MEQVSPEAPRPPETPVTILERIRQNQRLEGNMDIPTLFNDMLLLDSMNLTKKHRQTMQKMIFQPFGQNPHVGRTLAERLREDDRTGDKKLVSQDIRLMELLGLRNRPAVNNLLTLLENKYHLKERPPKKKRRAKKFVLAAGAAAIAAASIVGSGGLVAKPGSELSGKQTTTQTTPETATAVPPTSTSTETTKVNLNETLRPLIEEALKRRAERAKNDPEYYNRVDQELNQDRINILLYGHGEEWTGGYVDQPTFGSHSIFSVNLKTGRIDLVSPTHDIRAPEIEAFLKKNGKEAHPTRIDRAYDIGGFDLMRQVLEDATGLSVDYQIVLEDTFIKNLVDTLGGLTVDVPFDVSTTQFRDEGKLYPPHQFFKGSQKMDGAQALQFIKAWSDPVDPAKERNVRKHLAMRALFDQVKQKTKERDLLFGVKMFSLLAGERLKSNLGFDFDEKKFIFPIIGNLGELGGLDLSLDKTVFVVDPAIGDGGVQWVTANAAQNPLTKADIDKGLYPDLAMEIPFNADPYSPNLVRDYWKSVRDLIKNRLSSLRQPAIGGQESLLPAATATSTATPSPTETPTPKPTPTPEVKTFKKDIFREQIAPKIYKEILKRRAERAAKDPEYLNRINEKLNEGRINILITGGRENDPLTDTIQVLSYDFTTNTVHIISIPRDLQSPEVLKKTKDPTRSRINEALGKGGPALLIEAVENTTVLSVDLHFHANFDVLTDFINKTVGTIDIELDSPIVDNEYPTENNGYKRIYYPKGINTLTGEQALEVARSRHGSSDYERAQRQQKIMEAFIKKLLSENIINQIRYLKTIDDLWYQKVQEGRLKPDFDINQLFFSDLLGLVGDTPGILWERATGGRRIAEMPTIFATGISNRNFVVGAGITDKNGNPISITKISSGNPNTSNPRKDYWPKTRGFIEKFLTEQAGEPPEEEEIKIEIPAKEQRILHPRELSYSEVKPWIGKLRDSHDAVLTESLFTKELAGLTKEKRAEVMKAIATAHAKATIEYYGDVETIIGLDPGHGGSDVGSSGTAPGGKVLAEKDLTWELSQMIAEEIYQQSSGKYTTVFLRPENPNDEDLDGDGVISAMERIQKRKALLLEMEKRLRASPSGINLLYLAVHFNGDAGNPNLRGTETFWPNETGVANEKHLSSSRELAQKLHQAILSAIRDTGYQVVDRGAKEDPDKRTPLANSETQTGPYLVLGSAKLDRILAKR